MNTAMSLPAEIWLHIHRLATSDASPMNISLSEQFQYIPITDPLQDVGRFWRNAYSLVLVCRLWSNYAKELLYENIQVDVADFDALYDSLTMFGNARLVRSVRLSNTRFDRNTTVLAICPGLRLVVLSNEGSKSPLRIRDVDTDHEQFGPFHSLTHIYWTEATCNASLLRKVLAMAPNISFLFLTNSTTLPTDVHALPFPESDALQKIKHLSLVPSCSSLNNALLAGMKLQTLTRLTCSASFFAADAESEPDPPPPVFPFVRIVELFGSRSTIPFNAIFLRCPRLQELCYDVWSTILEPEKPHRLLSSIRLHSAVTVVRDWATIKNHFNLLLSPTFATKLQRIVLYNNWYRVVANKEVFSPFRDGLTLLGAQVEFPEGHVR
ncbi:hypothetical protein R3P38DRAFT_3396629 [Favolaschia claudopus]|uniref:F-box domain-containing protein n=1 Tax=Favolaschia claudopus TaxID=2862362 RepID=A0AAW0B9I4_9AGAR